VPTKLIVLASLIVTELSVGEDALS